MSRYDGLIIPRSYSEYINKTDAATLSQALQLNNVLAQEVAAGNNKAVTSNAVNGALANYGKSIIGSGDLNSITEEGEYTISWGAKLINEPIETVNERLLIVHRTLAGGGSFDYTWQEWRLRGNSEIYVRSQADKVAGTWSSWEKIALKSDLVNQKVIDCNNAVPTQSTVKTYGYDGERNEDTHLPTKTLLGSNYGNLTTRASIDEQGTTRADQFYMESGETSIWCRTGYKRLDDTEFSWKEWYQFATKNDLINKMSVIPLNIDGASTEVSINCKSDINEFKTVIVSGWITATGQIFDIIPFFNKTGIALHHLGTAANLQYNTDTPDVIKITNTTDEGWKDFKGRVIFG